MKVLMISTDSSILKFGSDSQRRMIEYGSLAEKLFIVVLSKKRVSRRVLDISQNVRVYSAYFWSAWRLGKILNSGGISAKGGPASGWDLVTAQDPFETGLIGYLAARRLKAKLQLQIHTDFLSPYFAKESIKNRIRVWLAKWLLPKANSIRVVSERIKKSLSTSQLVNYSTIYVLPIFVDITKIQSGSITVDLHQKYPQFDFIILMASRLTKEKNTSLAIKAMSEVVKVNNKAGLIIVGDGSEKENLRLRTYDLGLTTNVIFESWSNDLISYYKTVNAFVNTSNYEGYSRTLIEAAAAGCPIITTDVGVVGEVINKDNSLVIPVGDAVALTKSILKLIEDESLWHELSQKAQAAVQNLGNKEFYLQKYEQSWRQAL